MCKWGDTIPVTVAISADLSSTGKSKQRIFAIDSCIAPIVDALQKAGIDMRASCCGHGNGNGEIELEDGRKLIIEASS